MCIGLHIVCLQIRSLDSFEVTHYSRENMYTYISEVYKQRLHDEYQSSPWSEQTDDGMYPILWCDDKCKPTRPVGFAELASLNTSFFVHQSQAHPWYQDYAFKVCLPSLTIAYVRITRVYFIRMPQSNIYIYIYIFNQIFVLFMVTA